VGGSFNEHSQGENGPQERGSLTVLRRLAIRPEDVGCTSVRRSPLGKDTIVGPQPSDDSKACIPQSVNFSDQSHDFESEVFLAKLRWALRQPEIRELLILIVKEAISDDNAA